MRRDGRLHREKGDDLEKVVLHHIAEGADVVVEPTASFDAKRFGHRDLHRGHVISVPHGFENRVRETEHHQILDGLLAQEVVDPKHGRLVEIVVKDFVQFLG